MWGFDGVQQAAALALVVEPFRIPEAQRLRGVQAHHLITVDEARGRLAVLPFSSQVNLAVRRTHIASQRAHPDSIGYHLVGDERAPLVADEHLAVIVNQPIGIADAADYQIPEGHVTLSEPTHLSGTDKRPVPLSVSSCQFGRITQAMGFQPAFTQLIPPARHPTQFRWHLIELPASTEHRELLLHRF